jgi:parallel beta-helix repeat protein
VRGTNRIGATIVGRRAASSGGEEDTATLWVNGSTGNDSLTIAQVRAGGGSLAWQTIGRAVWGSTNRSVPVAAQAAVAGDIVQIAAGTYTATAGSAHNNDVWWNPANSGSSGSPIIFRGYTSESLVEGSSASSVILQRSSGSGPLIGTVDKHYIEWDGFFIDEVNATPIQGTGPVSFQGGDHCAIRNCEIAGTIVAWGDNHTAVFLEFADNTTVSNNRFYGFGSNGDDKGQNDAGVMFYDSSDCVIEHNTIYECGAGVYVKGDRDTANQARNIVRFNWIADNGFNDGIGYGIVLEGSQDGQVYQNVVLGNRTYPDQSIGLTMYTNGPDENDGPRRNVWQNNTVVGHSKAGVNYRGGNEVIENERLYNNIFSSCRHGADGNGRTQPNDTFFEHSVWHNMTEDVAIFGAGVEYTLATWKSTFSQDSVSPAAISSDPLFVNAAADDYRLQGSSPALTLGRDLLNISGLGVDAVIPAGAYITGTEIIGVQEP